MFITIEGPDGGGKTTQMNLLVPALEKLGFDVVRTREPGGTPIGDQIRSVIMDMKNKSMHPRAEILLFCASRASLIFCASRASLIFCASRSFVIESRNAWRRFCRSASTCWAILGIVAAMRSSNAVSHL